MKELDFFKHTSWNEVENKTAEPPFVPPVSCRLLKCLDSHHNVYRVGLFIAVLCTLDMVCILQ